MASSSSCPATYLPGKAAPAPPPLPLLRVAGPSPRGGQEQRARGSTAQGNLRKIIAIITTVLPPQPQYPNALASGRLAPPPPAPLQRGERENRILSVPSEGHGIRVDLRLRLGSPWEMGRGSSPDQEDDHDAGLPSSACSFVGEGTTRKLTGGGGGMAALETAESGVVSASYDGVNGLGTLDSNSPEEERSSEGEWDAEEEEVKEATQAEERGGVEAGEARPCSEITNIRGKTGGGTTTEESDATKGGGVIVRGVKVVAEKKSGYMSGDDKGDTGGRCRRRDDEGYLGLLLEAVRQVSDGLSGDESPRKEEGRMERSKRRGCWAAAFDHYEVAEEEQTLGPVVRSKRGRNQVLPSRYRDSVLEPWRKQPGGGGGHHRYLKRRQARTGR